MRDRSRVSDFGLTTAVVPNKRKPWFHFPDPLIEHTVFFFFVFFCLRACVGAFSM